MQAKFFLIRENEIPSYVLKSIKFDKNTSRIQNGNFHTYSTAGSSNPNNLKKSYVISIQNKYIYIHTHTHTHFNVWKQYTDYDMKSKEN